MQTATGQVVNGQIVLDGDEPLPEGARVLLQFLEDDDEQELTAEEQAELAESDAAISRGEFVTMDQLFHRAPK